MLVELETTHRICNFARKSVFSRAKYSLRKRGFCYGNVADWVAGWLDVTHRYCISTAKPILILFDHLVAHHSRFFSPRPRYPIRRGLYIHGDGKNWGFSTEIAVYLGNAARLADDYYGTLIGSNGCRIECYHFR